MTRIANIMNKFYINRDDVKIKLKNWFKRVKWKTNWL
jgi:hypothetical protein